MVLAVLSGLTLLSCNETKEVGPGTVGYDFYPIKVGQYRIYEVQEIRYRIAGFDTSIYQLRETIFDSIRSQDQVTYLLRRDIRTNTEEEWESDSVWSLNRGISFLSITENNIPFIKLTFPVSAGNEWDGNGLNSKDERIYTYQEVAEGLVDSVAASDHIRVIIEDIAPNVTGVDQRSEVYARGIGLVEKDYLTQENCTASNCGADLGKVIGGRALKQTLITIGNE